MYNNTTTRVVSPDSSTDYLKTLSGVLQGDTLALYPFIIIINYALWKGTKDHEDLGFTLVKRRSRRYPSQRIMDTGFADDITTFSDALQSIETAVKELGLLTNEKKIELCHSTWTLLFNH